MMRKVASVEARMGSSRLPGKVMTDILGKPAIERLFERLLKSKYLDGVVLATSTSTHDDPLEKWAQSYGIPCYRGSEVDVLNRVVKAHEMMKTDLVIEVTGDCTLVDSRVIDLGISTFLANDCDVVSNTWKPTYPMGVDVQVFPLKLLQEVEKNILDKPVREHVSLYFYEHPEKYKIINLVAPDHLRGGELRFQLDYPEDLEFIKMVFTKLEPAHGINFGVEEIFNLLKKEPHLLQINQHCVEKPMRQD